MLLASRTAIAGLIAVGVAAAGAASIALAADPAPAPALAQASAEIKDPTGAVIGNAVFKEGPTGVLVHVTTKGLTPGWHGMHFHEKGDCSDPKFMNSGAHMNHADVKVPHGLLNPKGPDYGDLPNLYVGTDGTGDAEAFTSLVSFKGEGGRPALLAPGGRALVIHANPDDHTTQPIGGAGARVACGVVK